MSPAAEPWASGDTLQLSPARSNFLNAVRWFSAAIVLVGHVERWRQILTGAPRGRQPGIYSYCAAHAHVAVMFFFVLSGYLVGYAAHKRSPMERSLRGYALDRWSRIYAVLPSAVALTLLLDVIGSRLSPNYHSAGLYPPDHFVLRLLANLLSLQGIGGHRIQFGTNPALWSIGYEVWYYAAFGLIFFRRSIFRRRSALVATLAVMAIVAGPKMFAYSAIWALGYATFRLYHLRRLRLARIWFAPLIALTFFANHLLAYRQIFQLPEIVADLIIAVCFSAVLLCDIDSVAAPFRRINTHLADFSYSVYAYHMPITFFWFSLAPARITRNLPAVVIGTICSLVCVAVARALYTVFEVRRPALRARTAALLDRRRDATAGDNAPSAR